jgi:hypothetical protein
MNFEQTNFDLEDKMKEIKLPLVGVFSRNEIPSKLPIGNYIFNTNHSGSGKAGHWTCCIVYMDHVMYWDSFGIGPLDELVKKAGKKKIFYNDKIIQQLEASTCGYWCLAFFLWMQRVPIRKGESLLDHYQKFIDKFESKKQSKNEQILREFLKPF